jgi:hypothetical protein
MSYHNIERLGLLLTRGLVRGGVLGWLEMQGAIWSRSGWGNPAAPRRQLPASDLIDW